MTITRNVNGKEIDFELTKDELYRAFEEQEHLWDVDSVSSYVPDDTDIDTIDEIAYEMRRLINKYDVDMEYAIDEAVSTVLSRRNLEAISNVNA